MIWFILAAVSVVVAIALTAVFFDIEDCFSVGAVAFILAAAVALTVNVGVGLIVDSKPVVTTQIGISGPVRIVNTADDGLLVQATGDNRQTYSSVYGFNLKFKDGDKREIIITDYRLGNPWLSVFNFRGDDMTFQIPQSERVALDR